MKTQKQVIISIGREFGSAGHEIAERIAKRYGLSLYDHNLLREVADSHNVNPEELEIFDEMKHNKFLYRTVKGMSSSPADNVAMMQFNFLREKAEKGTDLKEFSQVPFLLHEFPERMRQIEEQCFYRAGFSPRIFMETRSTELRNILYGCQFGALFCRRSQVRSLRKKFPGCHAFPIIPAAGDWDDAVYFVRQKSSWTPAHVLEFEKLMQRAWKEIAQH